MKYLGIDYGLKKIGLAIGDDETKISAPLEVIEHSEDLIGLLTAFINNEDIEALVVGMPQQEQGEVTKKFVQALKGRVNIPVHLVDESYSSVESQRIQKEQGSGVEEDALAAMLILQSFFDTM